MPVKIITNDIWDYPADIRINTVNCVGVMGRGIALEFKDRFPRMFIAYAKSCRAREMKPGEIFYWTHGDLVIWNVATKDHWRDKSQYNWIEKGIQNMKDTLDAKYSQPFSPKELKIAMPAMGCSNGGLDFSRVKTMIIDAMDSSRHEIALFPPI